MWFNTALVVTWSYSSLGACICLLFTVSSRPAILSVHTKRAVLLVPGGLLVQYRGALRSRGVNHPSSLANQAVVGSYISNEVQVGRLVGPIPDSFQGFVHTSPIGLVPKGHASGKWRMIVDLSSPRAASVNSGIEEALCSLRYASLDDKLS